MQEKLRRCVKREHCPQFSRGLSFDLLFRGVVGLKARNRASGSGSVYLRLGSITFAVGGVLAGRALFHIVWHQELSFLSDGMKSLLILALGTLLLWAWRKERANSR